MKLTMTMISIMVISTLVLELTIKISKKSKFSREKNTPFECGFTHLSSARKPFSISFFLIAIMFLIFDMEISIILPMMYTKMSNMTEWTMYKIMIMMTLTIGLIHEWNMGMLEWKH